MANNPLKSCKGQTKSIPLQAAVFPHPAETGPQRAPEQGWKLQEGESAAGPRAKGRRRGEAEARGEAHTHPRVSEPGLNELWQERKDLKPRLTGRENGWHLEVSWVAGEGEGKGKRRSRFQAPEVLGENAIIRSTSGPWSAVHDQQAVQREPIGNAHSPPQSSQLWSRCQRCRTPAVATAKGHATVLSSRGPARSGQRLRPGGGHLRWERTTGPGRRTHSGRHAGSQSLAGLWEHTHPCTCTHSHILSCIHTPSPTCITHTHTHVCIHMHTLS